MKTFIQLVKEIDSVITEASDESMAKAAQASKAHGHDYHQYHSELKKIAHHMDAGHDYKTAVAKAHGDEPKATPKPSTATKPSTPSKSAHKAATGTGHIHVHSNYEDGHGKVKVHVHDTKSGEKKSFTVHHGYAEDHGDKMPSAKAHSDFKKHLSTKHSISSDHAHAVATHFRGVTSDQGHKKHGVKHGDSKKAGYTVHSIH